MRRVLCLVVSSVLLLLVSASPTQAQSSSIPPSHQHSPGAFIDGSLHPEQIPDLTAYRLYLRSLSLSTNPTDKQKKAQSAELNSLFLNSDDQVTISSLLQTYRSRYEELITNYNVYATAAEARGESVDPTALLQQLDQLTQTTHDSLKSILSPHGWQALDGHVQNEKHHMRMGVNDAGGQP